MCLMKAEKSCLASMCLFLFCELCGSAVFFPSNSAYGIFAAIAIPLDLPHRNVFLSYNFEANYNLPNTWGVPPGAIGLDKEEIYFELDGEAARYMEGSHCTNCTANEVDNSAANITSGPVESLHNEINLSANRTSSQRRRRKRMTKSLLTRTHFYHILKDKFERSGYEAEPCLLRLICETNASGLGEINGVLGTLVHIIFSPSTSVNEYLPLPYYQAEIDGVNGVCEHYANECESNPLDLISVPIYDIINSLAAKE